MTGADGGWLDFGDGMSEEITTAVAGHDLPAGKVGARAKRVARERFDTLPAAARSG